MQLSETELNRNRNISLIVTLVASGFIVTLLFLFNITSSIFKSQQQNAFMVLESGNGQFFNNSSDNNNSKSKATLANVSVVKSPVKQSTEPEPIQTSEMGEVIKHYRKFPQTIKTESEKQNDSQELNSVTTGGPEKGISGTESIIDGKQIIELANRKAVKSGSIINDTKEEGKVVVEVWVDKAGNVIEANPNGRGTTTASSVLKSKAKQVALATKFNEVEKPELQKGTISIIFSFD